MPDLAGGLAGPAPHLALGDQTGSDARSDPNAHRTFRLSGRAQPSFAVRAQVAVVADRDRHMESAFQVRAQRYAGKAHVGRDDDVARLRLHDARHGDADGGEVGSYELGLGEHLLHHRFHHRQNLFGAAGSRRRLPLLSQDGPRLADQRGLDLRAADIDAHIEAFAVGFCFHHLLLSHVIESENLGKRRR